MPAKVKTEPEDWLTSWDMVIKSMKFTHDKDAEGKPLPVAWDLKIYDPEDVVINNNENADTTWSCTYKEAETVRDLNRIQRDTLEAILKRYNIKHQFLGVNAKGERC